MTAIVAASFTKFGKRSESVTHIAAQAAFPIVQKFWDSIDFVVLSNAYSGEFNAVSGLNNLVTTFLSLDTTPSVRVDNTSASGGSALFLASSLIESGRCKCVLLIGAEKMSEKNTKEVTSVVSSLLPPRERASGVSLPSLAALAAKIYLSKYGAKREAFAQVAVKNHENGALNPFAHIQKRLTLEEVLSSRVIAHPLTLYEFSPISDGACSVLLTANEFAQSFTEKPVYIKAFGYACDSAHISSRAELCSLKSVKDAAQRAYKTARITPSDVNFAELHDMATVLEVIQCEELGLFERGKGWEAAMRGDTSINGEKPVNTSGGLNAKGHPIGATGVAQAAEAFLQIRGEAGARQVKGASVGLSVNMGGFGNSSVVTIFGDQP
ncbi:acetyl-CoA acetyltransferase [Candidatus Marsarchaeota G2 archaeon ECH_B_SAG-G16]|uniref:Acetyl-CoA acetyltransferase n=7 Tax=Candidatus Marsarchaeota TaxID=1978152 RepID=A0A2R6C3D5_9ARCH|nr:MAG: acetyl-CoA acetyltransferase [Candidatus Marsarchaeota G1 archaeon OSP_D]PSN86397.1 MAG: acetyl-CoA acetyltransferase [Candidatus Marsarchaeota G1 archaeon BE_D]PSN87635.1 MAG: acetyl-CoA acetyltransferase [Candidatus Marsarchaeota G1 archaeon OSP_C]PSN93806.1 MAG: acetyl-CoA acetyltransferase [Candidatus Marsarchaeota G1 archaeon OSP_B]PSO03654.1 MAG: acetyl-CoA acetyltransferase [Candidatus Marsarchaeota G2 archaeon ECH_B_SAG-E12]PSO05159.1 MAG: acetyl-CoA acetyltransferase [Candidat